MRVVAVWSVLCECNTGVFCVGRAWDKQTRDTFQSSRFTGVRLWTVSTLQTLWRKIGERSRSWNKGRLVRQTLNLRGKAYTLSSHN